MNKNELLEHYDNYVENCTESEIPLKFEEWQREYKNDLLILMGGTKYARKCTCCGKGMNEGYFANYEYFCSDSCLHTKYTAKEWEELASDGVEDEEGNDSYYWTEWETEEDFDYVLFDNKLITI